MQRHTPLVLTLMAGLLLGRLVRLHDLEVAEVTCLFLLAICYRSEILDGIQRFAARPAVRAYVVPRSARVHGMVLAAGVIKRLILAAAILFGGLLLIVDALRRTNH